MNASQTAAPLFFLSSSTYNFFFFVRHACIVCDDFDIHIHIKM